MLLPFKCKFKGGGLRPTAPFACAAFTGRVFAIAGRLGAACGHGVGDRLFGPAAFAVGTRERFSTFVTSGRLGTSFAGGWRWSIPVPAEQLPAAGEGCAALSVVDVDGTYAFGDGSTGTNAYHAKSDCVWALKSPTGCVQLDISFLTSEAPGDKLMVYSSCERLCGNQLDDASTVGRLEI